MWSSLKQLCPDLEKNVKYIVSDYEKAAISSMKKAFPEAEMIGCWFHFCQVRLKKKFTMICTIIIFTTI